MNETLFNLKKIKKDQGKIIPYFLHSTFLLVKSRFPWSFTVSGWFFFNLTDTSHLFSHRLTVSSEVSHHCYHDLFPASPVLYKLLCLKTTKPTKPEKHVLSFSFRNYPYKQFHLFPGFRTLQLLQESITIGYLKKIGKNN